MKINVYKNVFLGKDSVIDEFVVIGNPPRGKIDGELETRIGNNAIIRSSSVIYSGCNIGDNFQTGHNVLIREFNIIGNNVTVGTNTVIERSSFVGNDVTIHSGAFVPEYTEIYDNVFIGPNVVLTNALYPRSPLTKDTMKGPCIKDNVKIGANSTILPEITINENSLIGAGSVVTNDVPRNSVVIGNPGKIIKNVNELEYRDMNLKAYPGMFIPSARPMISGDERRASMRVLASGRYVKGTECEYFENEFAFYCGVKHGVGVNSGLSALLLTLIAFDVRGGEVITAANSFVATANAIVLAGAKPVFVDVEEKTYNMDVKQIEKKVNENTKAIIPVHLYGHPAEMDEIIEIAKDYKLKVIEDACQAHGAEYKGKKTGSIGDAACFSFFPTKNMTVAGDGGMVVTNNESIARRIKILRNHGRESGDEAIICGFNSRLNEINAAIGRIQLKKLDTMNLKRGEIADIYNKTLKDVVTPSESKYVKHVYHQYTIRAKKRDELKNFLRQNNIETSVHYLLPIHLQKAFKWVSEKFPVAESLSANILSLPMFPELTKEEILFVCDKINEFYKK